ncbi:MAG: septum formation inhibitor Maf [Bacteriovoracaceae bacterium]|nr:septum formation inhibitor Maf [Bacteriovoracaceae bacterium]
MGRDLLSKKPKIILASASPRRRDLLKPFFSLKIIPADCDERQRSRENSSRYVKRIAVEKWKIVARKLKSTELVVAADTIVVLNEKILGKPKNRTHAKKMLQALSGEGHFVLSAVAVGWSSKKRPTYFLSKTKVFFRKLAKDEISDYLRRGEWRGKAGSYAVQGRALTFVSRIEGSLTGVVGLPLNETLSQIEKIFSHPLL